MKYIVTFPSTHMAMKFEELINKKGISAKLVPVPRKLSSNCGLAGSFAERKDLDQALSMCKSEGVNYDHAYILPDDQDKEPEIIE